MLFRGQDTRSHAPEFALTFYRVGYFRVVPSSLHPPGTGVGYVAVYRAHKKVTIVNQEEVLPLPNVDLKAGRRKSAPG